MSRISTFILFFSAMTSFVSAAPAARTSAALAIVQESPLVVEGRGFKPGERVTVQATFGGEDYKQTVTADKDGKLKVKVADLGSPCTAFRVSATGSGGSRAVTPRTIPPPCGMQPQQ
jgi:hypothetical protein